MKNKVVIFEAHRVERTALAERCLNRGDRVLLHTDQVTPALRNLSTHKDVQVRFGVRPHAIAQMANEVIR